MLEQGQSVRSPLPEEEGASETTCDEVTVNTRSPSPFAAWGERGKEMGLKLGWGEGVLRPSFISHYPTLV